MAWRLDKARAGAGSSLPKLASAKGEASIFHRLTLEHDRKLLDEGSGSPSPVRLRARADDDDGADDDADGEGAGVAAKAKPRERVRAEVSRNVSSHLPNEEVSIDWLRGALRASKPGAGAGGAPERAGSPPRAASAAAEAEVAAGGRGGSWARRYTERIEQQAEARAGERDAREAAIRDYRPVVYDFSWLYASAKAELPPLVMPTPWKHNVWNRNRLCEYCLVVGAPGAGRVECRFCNVVAHLRCALPGAAHRPPHWVCDECIFHLEEARRRQVTAVVAQRRAIEMQTSAIALQAQLRMYTKHRMYKRMVDGMTAMQGMIRGLLARRLFRKQFGGQLRPYRLRVLDASGVGADGVSHPHASAVVTVVRGDALRDGAPAVDGAQLVEAMLFQFATAARPQDERDGAVAWHESFLVPSSSSHVKVVVTLANKDENGMPVFRGQAVLDVEESLLYYKRATFDAPLKAMAWEPRELANRALMRLLDGDASPDARARVALEVVPCSNTLTHSGALEEAATAFSRSGSKKRWWAVLVEGKLLFYSTPQDVRPKQSHELRGASVKVHKSGVIEIKRMDESVLVTHADAVARRKWYEMFKVNAARAKLPRPSMAASTSVMSGVTEGAAEGAPAPDPPADGSS